MEGSFSIDGKYRCSVFLCWTLRLPAGMYFTPCQSRLVGLFLMMIIACVQTANLVAIWNNSGSDNSFFEGFALSVCLTVLFISGFPVFWLESCTCVQITTSNCFESVMSEFAQTRY